MPNPKQLKSALFQFRRLIIGSLSVAFLSLAGFDYLPASQVLTVAGTAAPTYPGGETTYRVELLNQTDQIVYDGVLSMTLPSGFSYVPGSTVAMGEGWPLESREPVISGQTLTWGPYHLPAAGIQLHNPFGIHTLMNDCATPPALHLEAAKQLVGNGGYVTQLFYGIGVNTTGPSDCAISYVNEAYARNLIPILRLQGVSVNGVWQAPSPGLNGDYAEIAQVFARYVAGLPRRDTNPLYIAIWNEPDLWIEWSGKPNARQYARFFVAVARAIRQLGDNRIRLVNGALTPGNTAFLEQLLAVPNFKDAFDVWASHCYPYNHPPGYNNHQGTARYGTYAIDCYLQETSLIKRYGRTGFRVMLTETGYELGNNTFGFEGFAHINESNRANYISNAFAGYWQNWPEIVAVTPFQLSDTSGHWAKFDWLYPYPPHAKHLQFERVAALPKPAGQLKPYGFQITFRAKVRTEVTPGIYTSQLSGRDRDGHTVFAAGAAPVQVLASGPFQSTYLPLILKPTRRDGPWYFAKPETASPGAIVPDTLLTPATSAQTVMPTPVAALKLHAEPQAMALDESAGLGAVLLADGYLEIIDLTTRQTTRSVFIGDQPQKITAGPPGSGQMYVSMNDGLVQVDLSTGAVRNKAVELGRLRGMAWDGVTHHLYVADAEHDQLLIFEASLSRQQAKLALDCQPDQVILDSAARQLYLSCPAEPRVLAIQADTLTLTTQAALTGGPLLDLAFDSTRQRLYALNLLAPAYRGITVWQTPTLKPVALVAGAGDVPLQTASAMILTPEGQLLIPEEDGIWQINPADFSVNRTGLAHSDYLVIRSTTKTIYALDASAHELRIFQ